MRFRTVTLWLLATVCLSLPAYAQQVSLIVPQQSKYGYHWTALAGSDRQAYVTPIAETDKITAWAGDGKVVRFTANNHLSAGDVIWIRLMSSPGQNFSWQKWQISSATSTTFTIKDGTTGSGAEATGFLQKTEGANFTGRGTWEIVQTVGTGETFRIYTNDGSLDTGFTVHPVLKNVPAHVGFQVGPTPGGCSTSGTVMTGNRATHATIEFDLKFTSADDPTQTAIFHHDVCANGGGYPYQGMAYASPHYRQVYLDRYIPINGQVFGNTNQMMNWKITKAPHGSDARIDFPTFPQIRFYSGHTPGQVELQGCPAVESNPAACVYIGLWLSPNVPPAANPRSVEQTPCDIDPNVGYASIYEVGPNQQYKTLLEIPQQLAGPLLIRLHNDGPPGQPSVFTQQAQLNLNKMTVNTPSGKFDHLHPAATVCGVPNPTTGEPPILDGTNSVANSWASKYLLAPYSLIAFNGMTGPPNNDGKIKQVNTVYVAGFHVRNMNPSVSFTGPDGTKGTWGGSIPFRPFGIQFWGVFGIYTENVSNPFFDDCNTQQSGWPACTQDTIYEGNHSVGYGIANQPTEHMIYGQAPRSNFLLNLQGGVVASGQGTAAYSDRGTRSFHEYNTLLPEAGMTTASGPGGHSEIQDAYNYVLPDEYEGYNGNSTCGTAYSTAPDCGPNSTFGGWDWFAAITEEHSNSEFTIGNAYLSISPGAKYLGISTTHNTTGLDNASQAFYAYNTFAASPTALQGGQFFFEDIRLGTRDNPNEAFLPVVWPRAYVQNNIIPWKDNRTCAYTCAPFGLFGHALLSYQTNLVMPGQVSVAPNIQPTGWSAGGVYKNGVNTGHSFFDGWPLSPINQQLAGFVPANFISANRYPIDPKTLQLVPGSNAVGAASQLTGQLANYPPRFNAVDKTMIFKPRADLSTVGAFDRPTATTGGTAKPSPAPAPAPHKHSPSTEQYHPSSISPRPIPRADATKSVFRRIEYVDCLPETSRRTGTQNTS
ncbi:MAG: hypothetical protein C5B58_12415 [Acidobacteria bacterium]|nr:MAG: hypothetical protein C5B58_12415 [Acidobacteriota bacterium]